MRTVFCVVLFILFVIPQSFASRIVTLSLEELLNKSDFVVLASVTKVVNLEYRDRVTIKVSGYLKGESKEKRYTFTLSPRGLRDFDPELKKGDTGVFFLTIDKETLKVTPTYWGGVALFTKNHFHKSLHEE